MAVSSTTVTPTPWWMEPSKDQWMAFSYVASCLICAL